MNIIPIEDNNSDFESVFLKDGLPYCKQHGAMLKVSVFKEHGGGFWRCITGSLKDCRSGCNEIRETNKNYEKV